MYLYAFFLLLLLTACSDISSPDAIKLGMLAPITGPVPTCGEDMLIGLDLVLIRLNQTNGPLLNVILEDSQFSPKVAVSAATKLYDSDGVNFIVGDCGSSSTLAVAPLAEQRKKILFSPMSFADQISEAGQFIFRFASTPSEEVPLLIPFVLDHDVRRVGIIYLNNDYGKSYSQRFTSGFLAEGGEIVFSESAEPPETDFRTVLLKAQELDAQALLIATSLPQTLALLRQAESFGMDIPLFSTQTAEHETILDEVGDYAEDRLYFTSLVDVSSSWIQTNSQTERFYDLFARHYPSKVPNTEILETYDTILLLAQSISSCGDDPVCVQEHFATLSSFQSATGNNSMDSHGDVKHGHIVFKTVRDGVFVTVEGASSRPLGRKSSGFSP